LLIRREALDEVGLLDENFFMYTEEVDLCFRLNRAGWEILWEPRALVVHYGGQSTRQRKTEMFLRLYESKILFFRKHHGRFLSEAYKGLLLLASLPRILAGWSEEFSGNSHQNEARERAHNYIQLLKQLPKF
jgi:hypothetical protein